VSIEGSRDDDARRLRRGALAGLDVAQAELVEELLHQLSLVICTATEGSAADRVRVLVITKDVWSLRLGWDISFTGGGLDSLQLVPTETNLGGTHQIAVAVYDDDKIVWLDADKGMTQSHVDVFDEPYAVVREKAIESRILATSQYRVLGKLTDDDLFIEKWLLKTQIVTRVA